MTELTTKNVPLVTKLLAYLLMLSVATIGVHFFLTGLGVSLGFTAIALGIIGFRMAKVLIIGD